MINYIIGIGVAALVVFLVARGIRRGRRGAGGCGCGSSSGWNSCSGCAGGGSASACGCPDHNKEAGSSQSSNEMAGKPGEGPA